jgi:acyl transferase domain-containing protein
MDATENSPGTPAGARTPLTRAFETIRNLRAQLAAQSAGQPIAVVGMGVRFPGGIEDHGGYWDALAAGRDLVTGLSPARMGPFAAEWEGVPRKGGFLDEVMDFDAAFFGIPPREAVSLDPQHRLLLEVAWEALEDAALPPDRITGVSTGFFVGISNQDYNHWQTGEPDAMWGIGNAFSYAAGRVAYTLGLTGPAMAVDTACSSSLVATHLARGALLRGECEIALAAGVNLIVAPHSSRLISRTGLLAADGLCKPFDARANGFTRSEGCGVVVLKRLADAVRDNDRVHAVIQGSALNQDGRSASITAPNPRSQTELIASALADAGLKPADIGLIEAHGTGTATGDPIEMESIITALAAQSGGSPLRVTAVKSNVGHQESAAGIAGLIKAVLCVKHRAIPPLVHFGTLNPRIDLAGTGITLPTALEPWSPEDGPFAGVSSFGMSGTNAHVIVGPPEHGPAPDIPSPAGAPGGTVVPVAGFELAARNAEALRVLAGRYRDRLAALPDTDYPAFAYTATTGRARHPCRARVAAGDRAAAVAALDALAAGVPVPAVALGEGGGRVADDERLPRAVVDLPHYPWQRRYYAARPRIAAVA